VAQTVSPLRLLGNQDVRSGAWSLAISPDGSRVYTYNTGIPPGKITIINAANNTIIPPPVPVAGCSNDSWITISPDGAFLYIACNPTGSIAVFDTASNSVITSVPIAGAKFTDLVTNQAGTRLYVADVGACPGHKVVQVLDTTTPAAPVVLPVVASFSNVDPSGAIGIAFSNSQNRLYVPRPVASNDLAAIDIGTSSVTSIAAPGWHVSTDPSGTRAYLLDGPPPETLLP
jgi:DNA-binding beta-propeller fold protein YncE